VGRLDSFTRRHPNGRNRALLRRRWLVESSRDELPRRHSAELPRPAVVGLSRPGVHLYCRRVLGQRNQPIAGVSRFDDSHSRSRDSAAIGPAVARNRLKHTPSDSALVTRIAIGQSIILASARARASWSPRTASGSQQSSTRSAVTSGPGAGSRSCRPDEAALAGSPHAGRGSRWCRRGRLSGSSLVGSSCAPRRSAAQRRPNPLIHG
jgi:hypothetical protein